MRCTTSRETAEWIAGHGTRYQLAQGAVELYRGADEVEPLPAEARFDDGQRAFLRPTGQSRTLAETIGSGDASVSGDSEALRRLEGLFRLPPPACQNRGPVLFLTTLDHADGSSSSMFSSRTHP
ncbi:hypothetical protein [Streptomyces sp. NPDC096323]|uniref:hypothetical protein n=1 Tax=Streptomyces sp. NPDC096323 TaxID=3155822 RepID=UPI003330D69E